jgi:hypothetical protein
MRDDDTGATRPASGPGAEPGRVADVPTRPSRPGTVAHQRHVHEMAAEERRKADERPAGSSDDAGHADDG